MATQTPVALSQVLVQSYSDLSGNQSFRSRAVFSRGRARERFGRGSRPLYQICDRVGHISRRSFYKFDDDSKFEAPSVRKF